MSPVKATLSLCEGTFLVARIQGEGQYGIISLHLIVWHSSPNPLKSLKLMLGIWNGREAVRLYREGEQCWSNPQVTEQEEKPELIPGALRKTRKKLTDDQCYKYNNNSCCPNCGKHYHWLLEEGVLGMRACWE